MNNSPAKSSDDDELADRVQMKGLSLKDALDLILRFNEENIPLSQFLDGCEEAKSIVPEEFDPELAKLIQLRLYGDAPNAARAQKFENLKEIAEFFEKTLGSAKTYFDLTGEMAKVNEPVIVYANRLKEIENEIRKAAHREGRVGDDAAFATQFEKDCLKFFVKGLHSEIKARMAEPQDYKEALELAIETEGEYGCSVVPEGEVA